MFVCADCYAVCEGKEKHPESPACDEFDSKEEEDVVEQTSEFKSLFAAVALTNQRITELERKFDTIISAIIKASGAEEER